MLVHWEHCQTTRSPSEVCDLSRWCLLVGFCLHVSTALSHACMLLKFGSHDYRQQGQQHKYRKTMERGTSRQQKSPAAMTVEAGRLLASAAADAEVQLTTACQEQANKSKAGQALASAAYMCNSA